MCLGRRQTADEFGQQVSAQGPAGAEVAEDPGHVRHSGEHRAAPADGLGKVQRLAVDGKADVAEHAEVEAGGADDNVGVEHLARLQPDAAFGEGFDLVRDHRGLAFADALEQVGVGRARRRCAVARADSAG